MKSRQLLSLALVVIGTLFAQVVHARPYGRNYRPHGASTPRATKLVTTQFGKPYPQKGRPVLDYRAEFAFQQIRKRAAKEAAEQSLQQFLERQRRLEIQRNADASYREMMRRISQGIPVGDIARTPRRAPALQVIRELPGGVPGRLGGVDNVVERVKAALAGRSIEQVLESRGNMQNSRNQITVLTANDVFDDRSGRRKSQSVALLLRRPTALVGARYAEDVYFQLEVSNGKDHKTIVTGDAARAIVGQVLGFSVAEVRSLEAKLSIATLKPGMRRRLTVAERQAAHDRASDWYVNPQGEPFAGRIGPQWTLAVRKFLSDQPSLVASLRVFAEASRLQPRRPASGSASWDLPLGPHQSLRLTFERGRFARALLFDPGRRIASPLPDDKLVELLAEASGTPYLTVAAELDFQPRLSDLPAIVSPKAIYRADWISADKARIALQAYEVWDQLRSNPGVAANVTGPAAAEAVLLSTVEADAQRVRRARAGSTHFPVVTLGLLRFEIKLDRDEKTGRLTSGLKRVRRGDKVLDPVFALALFKKVFGRDPATLFRRPTLVAGP